MYKSGKLDTNATFLLKRTGSSIAVVFCQKCYDIQCKIDVCIFEEKMYLVNG